MVFKEILNSLKGNNENKQRFKEIEDNYRMQKILEERQKSSNQRELERYMKEEKRRSRCN